MSATYRWLTGLDRIFDEGERELPDLAALLNLRRNGACVGMDNGIFFPKRGNSALPAKVACWGCPVRVDCLAYAIENHVWDGIWGGTNEKERRPLWALLAQGVPAHEVAAMAVAGDLDAEMAEHRSPQVIKTERKTAPYGWRVEAGELVTVEEEQRVLERLRQVMRAGAKAGECARWLNAVPIRTRRGQRWTAISVVKVLNSREALTSGRPSTDERQAS